MRTMWERSYLHRLKKELLICHITIIERVQLRYSFPSVYMNDVAIAASASTTATFLALTSMSESDDPPSNDFFIPAAFNAAAGGGSTYPQQIVAEQPPDPEFERYLDALLSQCDDLDPLLLQPGYASAVSPPGVPYSEFSPNYTQSAYSECGRTLSNEPDVSDASTITTPTLSASSTAFDGDSIHNDSQDFKESNFIFDDETDGLSGKESEAPQVPELSGMIRMPLDAPVFTYPPSWISAPPECAGTSQLGLSSRSVTATVDEQSLQTSYALGAHSVCAGPLHDGTKDLSTLASPSPKSRDNRLPASPFLCDYTLADGMGSPLSPTSPRVIDPFLLAAQMPAYCFPAPTSHDQEQPQLQHLFGAATAGASGLENDMQAPMGVSQSWTASSATTRLEAEPPTVPEPPLRPDLLFASRTGTGTKRFHKSYVNGVPKTSGARKQSTAKIHGCPWPGCSKCKSKQSRVAI